MSDHPQRRVLAVLLVVAALSVVYGIMSTLYGQMPARERRDASHMALAGSASHAQASTAPRRLPAVVLRPTTTDPLPSGHLRPVYLIGCAKCATTTLATELTSQSPHWYPALIPASGFR